MSGLWGKLGCRQKFKMRYKWGIRSASPDWHLQSKVAPDSQGTPPPRARNISTSRKNCNSDIYIWIWEWGSHHSLAFVLLPPLWAPYHGNFGRYSLEQQSMQVWTQSQVLNRSNIYFLWVRDLSPSLDVATRWDRHSIHRVATFPWQ